ncbi:hypothetical protein EST38_g14178 [Candolleomyces aberdarensis]|uniref:HAT C-terminal dimerisation domain-containing protein n=1 Tax=Candolleomyces aberdarensis TaxID=2316362 RepID=A0A4Q2CXZ1_9AGAR|nr:hypothetical protein EST38_g14178 [Candolleomyces aberdarensis]
MVNQPATTGTKQNSSSKTLGPRKKRKTGTTDAQSGSSFTPAQSIVIPGIGPAQTVTLKDDDKRLHPAMRWLKDNVGSLLTLKESLLSHAAASDVWYFVRSQKTLEDEPLLADEKLSLTPPDKNTYPHLWCRLCMEEGILTIYKNGGGQNKNVQKHLLKFHGDDWMKTVVLRKLKGWESLRLTKQAEVAILQARTQYKKFTLQGFLCRLIKWIAVDDQSLDVIDCPELQDLLLYLNVDLTESNIPHRTKLALLIRELPACFPHIVNLAVKAGLAWLTQLSDFDDDKLDDELRELASNPAYASILQEDIIKRTRQLVHFIWDSGQRCADFEEVIRQGNKDGSWGQNKKGKPIQLRIIGLLKDVDTRWSSTYNMVDHVLELRLPIQAFFQLEKYEAHALLYTLSNSQLAVLNDIRIFLNAFHLIQQELSREKTLTLSLVILLYEKLGNVLQTLKEVLPEISGAISASQSKLREYLQKSHRTAAYTAAIVINPMMKLEWLRSNWPEDDYPAAKDRIFNTPLKLLKYRKALRQEGCLSSTPMTTAASARPLWKTASAPSSTPPDTTSESNAPAGDPNAIDWKAVEAELKKWEDCGILTEGHPEAKDFDLLRFWQYNQGKYSLLWQLALDTLPMQVSAVPCEQVFSSSKETNMLCRSSASPLTMEMLQIMKFTYRADHLSFTDHLLCSEAEQSMLDIEPHVIDRLMAEGKISELCQLINEAWAGWGNDVTPVVQ